MPAARAACKIEQRAKAVQSPLVNARFLSYVRNPSAPNAIPIKRLEAKAIWLA